MKAKIFSSLVVLTLWASSTTHSTPAVEAASDVAIPFQKFMLKNGLRLT